MGKTFKDLKALEKYLEQVISDTLQDDVAKKAQQTMQERIQIDVYSAYTPKEYNRRLYNGGLIDPKNIYTSLLDKNTLIIMNIAYDDENGFRDVPRIVETGQNYMYNSTIRGVPRPFTLNTFEQMQRDKSHVAAMRKGLKKRGIESV